MYFVVALSDGWRVLRYEELVDWLEGNPDDILGVYGSFAMRSSAEAFLSQKRDRI